MSTQPSTAERAPLRTGDLVHEMDAHHTRVSAALRGEAQPMPQGRLSDLQVRFGLDPLETDVLSLLWTCAYDPDLRTQIVGREPFSGQLTVRLCAWIFGHSPRVRLASESPLLLWRLVVEHPLMDGNAALSPDATMLAWLDGMTEPDRMLAGRIHPLEPGHESPLWQLPAMAHRLDEGLRRGLRWRVHLKTDDPLAARWFAAGLCRHLGMPGMRVMTGTFADGTPEVAVLLHRQAFLDGCVPCMDVADGALSCPLGVVPYPLQIVHGLGALPEAGPGVQDLAWTIDAPDAREREQLWRHVLPDTASWSPEDLSQLALCHEAGVSDIAAAAALQPTQASQAVAALRSLRRSDLAPLARRIDAHFNWSDMVLPEEVRQRLLDIAFEARERGRVWAQPEAARLFPYGRGLIALFAGPPGTGKTMAAQVIASDLGLDLLSVDISAVVSKWVGETSQHLQQLLSSPAARRAVLFFDEADAFYGKRVDEVRDAQDRFANIDTSHLMTALEAYPGIVLMASNLKSNIDPAFLRRIRHVVDFTKPDAPARERLWRQTVAALCTPEQVDALSIALPRLARVEATGAAIKNSMLSSLFAARRAGTPPDLRLLGEMLARELAKEGAGLSPRDLDSLLELQP